MTFHRIGQGLPRACVYHEALSLSAKWMDSLCWPAAAILPDLDSVAKAHPVKYDLSLFIHWI